MKRIKIPEIIIALTLLVILSCSKKEENVSLTPPTGEITVDKIVRQASLRNQVIPFSVQNEIGDDVTETTTFYVDGQEITGNSFSSSTVGEFEVYGKYTENGVLITTNTVPFSVIIPKRKVVLEDYTGTWCGFCPKVTAAIENVHELTEDIAVVAIHQTASSLPDPMHFEDFNILKDTFFENQGLPVARYNRTEVWDDPYETDNILSMAGAESDMSIAVLSKLEGNTLTVQSSVVYENGSHSGDKLVVYLVESGVIYAQTNYFNDDLTSPYYQLGNPIPDFVHNDALRLSLSEVLGDNITATAELVEFSKTFTVDIPSDYVVENLSLVVMVVDSDNSARNAQFADLGEDKSYE